MVAVVVRFGVGEGLCMNVYGFRLLVCKFDWFISLRCDAFESTIILYLIFSSLPSFPSGSCRVVFIVVLESSSRSNYRSTYRSKLNLNENTIHVSVSMCSRHLGGCLRESLMNIRPVRGSSVYARKY